MNEDYKNNEKDRTSGHENKKEAQKHGSHKRYGQRAGSAMLICFIVFILIYTVVNITNISSALTKVMNVLTPIILGAGFAYLLNPILKFFEFKALKWIKNKKLLRGLSLLLTYAVALGALAAAIFLVAPQLFESITTLLDENNLNRYIDNTVNIINGLINKYFSTHSSATISREQLISFVAKFFSESGDIFQGIGSMAVEYASGLVVGVKNFIFALFISLYILISKERLTAQANKIATAVLRPQSKKRFYRYVALCDRTFGGFLIGKIVDSLIIGLITLVTLFFFDMPFYLLVSAIVCVTNVIPVFGPFIGAIPSFFIILIVDPSKAFIFLILILIIQQLDGNVIGPKILGSSTGMNPLGVMISIIIMGDLFGVVGMILGVPIFAVALAIVNELSEDRLRRKNMPINTAEYYPENSLVDPYAPTETFTHWIFSTAGHAFGHLFKLIFGKRKGNVTEENTEKNTQENTKTDTEKDNKDEQ